MTATITITQAEFSDGSPLPGLFNAVIEDERGVEELRDLTTGQVQYLARTRGLEVVSGQEEPTDGAASDPRPDPRTHPEYWTE